MVYNNLSLSKCYRPPQLQAGCVTQVKGPEKDAPRSHSPRSQAARMANHTAERMNTRPCIREAELYQPDSLEHPMYQVSSQVV